MSSRILVVDDEASIRTLISEVMNIAGYQVAIAEDGLDALNQIRNKKFDLIVLDPPSFTKSRAKLQEALRGYKEINLRAFKLLSAGGLLATFCCSHHVDAVTFQDVILSHSGSVVTQTMPVDPYIHGAEYSRFGSQ